MSDAAADHECIEDCLDGTIYVSDFDFSAPVGVCGCSCHVPGSLLAHRVEREKKAQADYESEQAAFYADEAKGRWG